MSACADRGRGRRANDRLGLKVAGYNAELPPAALDDVSNLNVGVLRVGGVPFEREDAAF